MDSSFAHGILIVDDDIMILKLIKNIFQNHYEVKISVSAEEGLKTLRNGFRPAVIVADHVMPKMTGSEFLKQAAQFSPNSTRVLLVGHNETKDIVSAVGEASAYMYLTKPFMETELLQAIKVGIDYHKQKSILSSYQEKEVKLVTELKRLNQMVQSLNNEKSAIFDESMKAIASIIAVNEKFYFTGHTKYVNAISRGIGELMRLRSDIMTSIYLATQVHNIVTIKMPERFKLFSPYDIVNENDLGAYIKFFNESLNILKNISAFKDITPIVGQIYEHSDGTGLPSGLQKGQFLIEAQVVSIANIYHNKVYQLEPAHYAHLTMEGQYVQSKDHTARRHKKAIQFIENKKSWFDEKIHSRFMELVESEKCPELKPIPEDLVLNYVE